VPCHIQVHESGSVLAKGLAGAGCHCHGGTEVTVVVLPQFATKNHTVALSLFPPPRWDGEENQKEKGKKLVGWDENSLTEWQREKKTTMNRTDKSIYNMQCSHHPMLSLLLSSKSISFSQLPTLTLSLTSHGTE